MIASSTLSSWGITGIVEQVSSRESGIWTCPGYGNGLWVEHVIDKPFLGLEK